jgi:hypothetical protein
MKTQSRRQKAVRAQTLTLPELDQSKVAVLDSLGSTQSRRSYRHAMEEFIKWYCSEPRLTSRSDRGKGSGWRRMPSVTLNMALVAPMPRPVAKNADRASAGFLRSMRAVKLRFCGRLTAFPKLILTGGGGKGLVQGAAWN